MEFSYHKKATSLLCCLLLGIAIAGCLGGTEVSNLVGTETPDPDRIETLDPDATEVEDEAAKERALSAEGDYITSQLESAPCVEGWGLSNYGGIPENATIENRTDEGVYVEVTHPYWYGTEQDSVDYGTTALYLVTAENVLRVNGDDISPC